MSVGMLARMAHWIWRLVGWLMTLVIGVGGLGVALWIYKKQSHKALTYRVVSVSPLGPLQARGFTDLRLMKGDKTIPRPFLLTIWIGNTGDLEIRAADFEMPITLRPVGYGWSGSGGLALGMGSISKFNIPYKELADFAPIVVEARVATTNPPRIPVELMVESQVLRIKPLLLNVGDQLTVEMLINGDVSGIEVAGRIAGVRAITEERRTNGAALDDRKLGHLALRGAVITTFAALLAALVGAVRLTWRRGDMSADAAIPAGVTISLLGILGITTVTLIVFWLWHSERDLSDYAFAVLLLCVVSVAPLVWLRARVDQQR